MAITQLGILGESKKFNDHVGIHSCDFPAYIIEPQPTAQLIMSFFSEITKENMWRTLIS
jgi:hypothetical protein